MIETIKLRNFRSIGDKSVELTLKPLTIFAGPSGAGKSNLLYFIDWLGTKVSYPAIQELDPDIKKVYGIQKFDELIYACEPEKREFEWSVNVRIPQERIKDLTTHSEMIDWNSLGCVKPRTDSLGYRLSCRRVKESEGLFTFEAELKIGNQTLVNMIQKHDSFSDKWTYYSTQPPAMEWKFEDNKATLSIFEPTSFGFYSSEKVVSGKETVRTFRRFYEKCIGVLREEFSKIYLLTASRGTIEYSTSLTKEEQRTRRERIGRHGENMIEVLSWMLSSDRAGRRIEKTEELWFWSSVFGVRNVVAGITDDAKNLSSHYRDHWSKTELNLASASFGSRQILTMVTQLLSAGPGSTILIEEPEASLHPEYQALLPALFADVIENQGKQVVIATHSPTLLLALPRIIRGMQVETEAQQEMLTDTKYCILPSSDIAVYHVERSKEGATAIQSLDLSKDGFIKGGIPSFAKVEANLLKEILKND